MNKEIYEKYLVSPITKKTLHIEKKCRLYSGSENLKELCSSFGLKCISQEDFETAKNTIFTISVFKKP